MTTALVRTRAHLAQNRQMIVGHAIAAALAGMTPLPLLDEIVPSLVRRQLFKRIAESRGVDIDDDALRALADGRSSKPGWRNLVGATPLLGIMRRSLRVALAALNVYRHAESASRTFALATLFDHYCARQHVGGALDLEAAAALRERLERTVAGSVGSLSGWALRRAFATGLKRVVTAPAGLLEALRVRRLPAGEVEAEEIPDEELHDAAETVDRRAAGGFVDELCDAFERSP